MGFLTSDFGGFVLVDGCSVKSLFVDADKIGVSDCCLGGEQPLLVVDADKLGVFDCDLAVAQLLPGPGPTDGFGDVGG